MCWKHEELYDTCFDHVEWEDDPESIIGVLQQQYNVEIKDKGKFRDEFYEMLTKLHEGGFIQPKREK